MIQKEGDTLVQADCSGSVFETHRTVNVDDENCDKANFKPGSSNPFGNNSNLDLLTNIILGLFVLRVLVILFSLNFWSLVTFFCEH